MKAHVIWTNDIDSIENLRRDMLENQDDYFGLTISNSWEMACEQNDEYLEDEKVNLNVECGNDIVILGVLGLWDGYHNVSKDLHRGNINAVFGNTHSCEYITWYVDGNGDLRCKGTHHDGTNNYLYRAWKDGISETQKDNFRQKWAEQKATRKDLSRYTRKIGTYVAEVYGWKVRQ